MVAVLSLLEGISIASGLIFYRQPLFGTNIQEVKEFSLVRLLKNVLAIIF